MAQAVPAPMPSAVGLEIIAAIKAKRRVAFTYHGRRRVAEPQCLGVTATDAETLRGYLCRRAAGFPSAFRRRQDVGLHRPRRAFHEARANYKKGDSAMKTIFAEL